MTEPHAHVGDHLAARNHAGGATAEAHQHADDHLAAHDHAGGAAAEPHPHSRHAAAPSRVAPTRHAAVLVVSTRAANGVYTDRTGPLIVEWLRDRSFACDAAHVVADGPGVTDALRALIGPQPDVVLTSGGTGIHPGDRTPDQTRTLLDFELPGFAEELRRRGSLKVASALLSRGVAGVAGSTIVVNLPGSPGGVADGLALLDEVLDHMLDQLAGGDHAR